MEEKRLITRVSYPTRSVVVLCETGESYFVETKDVSPLGMGITMETGTPDIVGKDIIIVAETLIMYATVTRQVKNADGTFQVGINAKKFTNEVLEYLFEHIAPTQEQ